jgi:hypothetical protein
MQNALHGHFAPGTKRLARQARRLHSCAGAARERTSDPRPHESALHQWRIGVTGTTARRRHSGNGSVPSRRHERALPRANVVSHVGHTRMPPTFSFLGIIRRNPGESHPGTRRLGPTRRISGTGRRGRVGAHFPAAAKIRSSEYCCNSPIRSRVMSGFGYCATWAVSSA